MCTFRTPLFLNILGPEGPPGHFSQTIGDETFGSGIEDYIILCNKFKIKNIFFIKPKALVRKKKSHSYAEFNREGKALFFDVFLFTSAC
jgi:hypothetical protein